VFSADEQQLCVCELPNGIALVVRGDSDGEHRSLSARRDVRAGRQGSRKMVGSPLTGLATVTG
jgi:hypothetical protein